MRMRVRPRPLLGSPPHTRGKAHPGDLRAGGQGITPAYAGKSPPGPAGGRPPRDHPRIRGEKTCESLDESHPLGSPPHTRGKAKGIGAYVQNGGITPAYAGKRPSSASTPPAGWDHPRIRGEKPAHEHQLGPQSGSPPHTRGKELGPRRSTPGQGITPAYAGKRERPTGPSSSGGDHPRIRGEKYLSISRRYFGQGSPPHTRGKVVHAPDHPAHGGITPAYAGKRENRASRSG